MREHAEHAEARANAVYEQNRAALELISKSMDNVRDAFTKARRARDRFYDLLAVSSRARQHTQWHVGISTPSVQRAERSTTSRLHGTTDRRNCPRSLVFGMVAGRRSAVAPQTCQSGVHSTSRSPRAERDNASAGCQAQVSTAEFTPRDAPHNMNAQMMRVHEWVADQ